MKTLFRFFFCALLLLGWGLAAVSLHVVRTEKYRVVLIPKQKIGLTDTYVDARNFTIQDVADHPALFERVVQSDMADQFAYLVSDPHGDVSAQLADAVKNAPPPTTQSDNLSKDVKTIVNNAKAHVKSASTATSWWTISR